MSAAELLGQGERIIELEHRFNAACGFGPNDDTLPRRFLDEPVPTGLNAGRRLALQPMLDAYRALRGWSVPVAARAALEVGAVL